MADLLDHAGEEGALGIVEGHPELEALGPVRVAPGHPRMCGERRLHVGNADLHIGAGRHRKARQKGQAAQADVMGVKSRRGARPAGADVDRHIDRMPDELPHDAPPKPTPRRGHQLVCS